MISTVLFDLDGTLLDSAKDLHTCLEKVLKDHHRPSLNVSTIQAQLNIGSIGFLKLAFGDDISAEKLQTLREEFLNHYDKLILNGQSHFFRGTLELIQQLEEKNYRWGIVTNKYERFTLPTLKNLGLFERAAVIVCADHVNQIKPAAEPILKACKIIKTPVTECCYVGDSLSDMLAAKAAGMQGLLALWGYWPQLKYSTQDWPYTKILHQPADLLDWL